MNEKVKCKNCNGTGELNERYDLRTTDTGKVWMTSKICLRCYGEGELDWIDNIVGKKIVDPMDLQLRIQSHPTTEWGPYEEV